MVSKAISTQTQTQTETENEHIILIRSPALPGIRPWRPSRLPLVITVGSKFTLWYFHLILKLLVWLCSVVTCSMIISWRIVSVQNQHEIGGGGNAWGQKFITWPPKPNTYHRYKPFCLKDHILLVKKKSLPGNITFWTEMAILAFAEIFYIFIFTGLEPKIIVSESWTQ